MRVALDVAAVQRTRIDIPDTFVVGKEEDALADPHRPYRIAGQTQALEFTGVLRIDPYFAGRPAAVAFPVRRIVLVAPDHHAAVRTGIKRLHMSETKFARCSAGRRNRKPARVACVPCAWIAYEENFG